MITTVLLALALFTLVLRGIQTNKFTIESKNSFILEQFGLLLEGLNPVNIQSTSIVLYWKLFYLIRWILTVSILIFLRDLPALQVILLQLFSFLTLLIYSKTTIYFDLWTNRMYILNESAVFIYQFFLLSLLDDSVSADNRNTLGWGLVLVQVSTVGVNLMRLCQKVLGVISLKMKEWQSKRRSREATVRIRAARPQMKFELVDGL
jgi:hypothetical protein